MQYTQPRGKAMLKRIHWEDTEWELFHTAFKALRMTNPELSKREAIEDAMTHLPLNRQRPVHPSTVASITAKMKELEAAEVVNPKPVALHLQKTLVTVDLPALPEMTLSNVQELLRSNLAETKIAILESERRQVEMMDRMFRKMASVWESEEKVETLFAKDLVSLRRNIEALEEVRTASLKRHELQPGQLPHTRKPRVMIFGATSSQREELQRKLPGLHVEVGKDLKAVRGDFHYIVALTNTLKTHDRDFFNKHFAGRWGAVNGSLTRAVESVKNHLMLA